MLVAIHQPNFFPWLGYFDKLARADVFVMLDSVQLSRPGGSYTNRVKVLIGGRPAWITAPVVSGTEARKRIADVPIAENAVWRKKIMRTVAHNYGKAPYFEETMARLEPLIDNPSSLLAQYNLAAIRAFAEPLGIDIAKVVRSSELDVMGKATDLLVAITKAVGGGVYLCGGGAAGYQDDTKFAAAGLEVRYQNFRHPVYSQVRTQEFIPGLSIIDALMNRGFDGTVALLAI